MTTIDPFLAAVDRAVFDAEDWQLPLNPVRERALSALEREALEGPSWRVKPYERGPLDLLLALESSYVETAALRTISDEIKEANDRLKAAHGQAKTPEQLMFSLGPQEGKSSLVVFAAGLWLLLDDPDRRIINISYEKEIATRWGRSERTAILQNSGEEDTTDLGLRVGQETWAADRWQLDGHRGGVYSVGIRGAITGRPGDVVIVDDPFKDKAEARSLTNRQLVQERWRTVINPRLQPGSLVIVSHTRWHEHDLIGWLLSEFADSWRHLNIPAKSLGDGDPLERPKGVWLQSARGRTDEQWREVERVAGPYDFAALYQGTPQPAEGGLFKRTGFRYWRRVHEEHPDPSIPLTAQVAAAEADRWMVGIGERPIDLRATYRFLTVDLAASTKTSADWTVAAAWAINDMGQILLLDLVRKRVNPEQHWEHIGALAAKWACPVYVERSQYGTDLSYSAGREGVPLIGLDADKDKFTRAIPMAAKFAQGSVFLPPAAPWLGEYEAELLEFPNAQHDDMVDVTAYAGRVRSAYWVQDTPLPGQPDPGRARRKDATQRTLEAELGPPPDYGSQRW